MSIKIMSTVLLGSCLISSSFASNFLNHFMPKYRLNQTDMTSKSARKQSYTDFSGQWTGTCSASEGIQTVTIKNDYYYVEFDGQGYGIGQMLSESSSNKWNATTNHMLLTWNTEGTVLKSKDVFVTTSWVDRNSSEQTLLAFHLETTLTMDGDTLIVNSYQVNSEGAHQKGFENKCTFYKSA
ncbi:Uncharacterised protein [Legionella wadsworthii]|uniref:DUF1579 domain-containing protein n=1 Tax=Legionella wadsworthii TaxID=28088 RepID=A0A378LRQ3_9GAMM|nr:hypothetical protein [Legionella wadsworthii]STY28502.1 Uncharacterised protein [Legionella wadsworthii]